MITSTDIDSDISILNKPNLDNHGDVSAVDVMNTEAADMNMVNVDDDGDNNNNDSYDDNQPDNAKDKAVANIANSNKPTVLVDDVQIFDVLNSEPSNIDFETVHYYDRLQNLFQLNENHNHEYESETCIIN